ncbi:geminin-like [Ostrea edulis]|uniref:geminin-like n=1 Tax=Ostrea edulis TaxID=37623 RepID=UPI0024AEF5B1|nr:geminin-like [Ostrea edulis]
MEIGNCNETKENLGLLNVIHKGKMNKECDQSHGTRKIFQTLQSSAQNPQKLIGQPSVTKKNTTKLVPLKEPLTVYKDPKNEKTFDDKAVQTERLRSLACANDDIEQEAYDLMVSEEVPETYWKELAEQRRIALNDSLHENEMLHKEVEDLKEENSKLTEMAEKADYFADVIQTILGTDEESVTRKIKEKKDEKLSEESQTRSTEEREIISPEKKAVQSPTENPATSTTEIKQSND